MSQTTIRMLITFGPFVIGLLAIPFLVAQSKAKEDGTANIKKAERARARFIIYSRNFFLRKTFNRLVTQYSSLSCYSVLAIQMNAVKTFESAMKVAIAMPLVTLLVTKNVIIALSAIAFSLVYYEASIEHVVDSISIEMKKELALCVQSIRERYTACNSIPRAVFECDKGKLLGKPILQMYDMLTSTHSQEMLDEFYRTSPDRLIKTLALMCYNVNLNGDVSMDGTEFKGFSDKVIAFRKEVDSEVRRLTMLKVAFKSLPIIGLSGLCAMPFANWFLLKFFPGTTVLLKGMYGMVYQVVLIITTCIVYYVINNMNRPSVVNTLDRSEFIDWLLGKRFFRDIERSVKPNTIAGNYRLSKLINESISSKDLDYIYMEKVVWFSGTLVASIVAVFLFVGMAKSNLINNYKTMSFIDDTSITEMQYNQIKKFDKAYMSAHPQMEDVDANMLLRQTIIGMTEMGYDSQLTRVKAKYSKYEALSFHWYYIVICWISAWIGWFSPDVLLMLRRKLVTYEEGVDVAQLQTLLIVLSDTSMDVRRVLYWMHKQSTIYKEVIQYAYLEFSSDPMGSLERLKMKSNSVDMKRIVTKLESAVYDVSIHDAFGDMHLDKDQTMLVKEIFEKESMNSMKEWCKLICFIPLVETIALGFIGPIGIVGFTELAKTFSQLANG